MRNIAMVVCALVMTAALASAQDKPIKAEFVKKPDGSFELLRDGKPYYVNGACGWEKLEDLKAAGGNSIRTWGHPKKDPPLFDEAHKLGLTVCAGLWMEQVKEGFDYNNAAKVKQQFDTLTEYVRRNKDHPAILMWGIGNEYEGDGSNPNVWKALEDLTKAIKEIDPVHPTITVLAGISKPKVDGIKQYCPSLDALGINTYAALPVLPQFVKDFGWDKAYLVTEFGPRGWWECPATPWGAMVEMNSTEKADFYRANYPKAISSQKRQCLGSYFYFWGIQWWYGCFVQGKAERLEAVDVMTEMWSGQAPANRAPRIVSFKSALDKATVAPKSTHTVTVEVKDAEGDAVTAKWVLRAEKREPLVTFSKCIVKAEGLEATVEAPEQEGAYRLEVTVYDGKGNAADANLPFLVKK